MEELTEAQMRILKTATTGPFYPADVEELRSVKHLLAAGLLRSEAGLYQLSDEGLKYVTRRGLDGSGFTHPVS